MDKHEKLEERQEIQLGKLTSIVWNYLYTNPTTHLDWMPSQWKNEEVKPTKKKPSTKKASQQIDTAMWALYNMQLKKQGKPEIHK